MTLTTTVGSNGSARSAELLEGRARSVELELESVFVAHQPARPAEKHTRDRELVRSPELLPGPARLTQADQRGDGIPGCKLERSASLGADGSQQVGAVSGRNLSELGGRRSRRFDIRGHEQDLDRCRQQAG